MKKNQLLMPIKLVIKRKIKKLDLYLFPLATYPVLKACGASEIIQGIVRSGLDEIQEIQEELAEGNLFVGFIEQESDQTYYKQSGNNNDIVKTGSGNDIVIPGGGADKVETAGGDDNVVIFGIINQLDLFIQSINVEGGFYQSRYAEYIQYINQHLISRDSTLSDLPSKDDEEYEFIDAGEHISSDYGDILTIFGSVSLEGTILQNFETTYVDGLAIFTQRQFVDIEHFIGYPQGTKIIVKMNLEDTDQIEPIDIDISNKKIYAISTLEFEKNIDTQLAIYSSDPENFFEPDTGFNFYGRVQQITGIDAVILSNEQNLKYLHGIEFAQNIRFYTLDDPLQGTYLQASKQLLDDTMLQEITQVVEDYGIIRKADIYIDIESTTTITLSHDKIDISSVELYDQQNFAADSNIGFQVASVRISGIDKIADDFLEFFDLISTQANNDNARFVIYHDRIGGYDGGYEHDSYYKIYLKDTIGLELGDVLNIQLQASGVKVSGESDTGEPYNIFIKDYELTITDGELDQNINYKLQNDQLQDKPAYIRTYDGDDTVTTGAGHDIVRTGTGADTLNTGGGNDKILIVGLSPVNLLYARDNLDIFQFASSIGEEPGSIALNKEGITIGDYLPSVPVTIPDIVLGDSINAGIGYDKIYAYGLVDMSLLVIENVEELLVENTVILTAEQIQDFLQIKGDGFSSKIIIKTDFDAQSGNVIFEDIATINEKISMGNVNFSGIKVIALEEKADPNVENIFYVAFQNDEQRQMQKPEFEFVLGVDKVIVKDISDLSYFFGANFNDNTEFYKIPDAIDADYGIYILPGNNLDTSNLELITNRELMDEGVIVSGADKYDAVDIDINSGDLLALSGQEIPLDLSESNFLHRDEGVAAEDFFQIFANFRYIGSEKINNRATIELVDDSDGRFVIKDGNQLGVRGDVSDINDGDLFTIIVRVNNLDLQQNPYPVFEWTYTITASESGGLDTDHNQATSTEDLSIQTGGGDDVIDTGSGNDYVYSQAGNDIIKTGDGSDFIVAGAGDDNIEAGAGDDIIIAGLGVDTVKAGNQDDSIIIFGKIIPNQYVPFYGEYNIGISLSRDYIPYVQAQSDIEVIDGRRESIDGGDEGDEGDTILTFGKVDLRDADIINVENILVYGLSIVNGQHLQDFSFSFPMNDDSIKPNDGAKIIVKDLQNLLISDSFDAILSKDDLLGAIDSSASDSSVSRINTVIESVGTIKFDRGDPDSYKLVWYITDDNFVSKNPRNILGVDAVFVDKIDDLQHYSEVSFSRDTEFYKIFYTDAQVHDYLGVNLLAFDNLDSKDYIQKIDQQVLNRYQLDTYVDTTLDEETGILLKLSNDQVSYTDILKKSYEDVRVAYFEMRGTNQQAFRDDVVRLASPSQDNDNQYFTINTGHYLIGQYSRYIHAVLIDVEQARLEARNGKDTFQIEIEAFDNIGQDSNNIVKYRKTYQLDFLFENSNAPDDIIVAPANADIRVDNDNIEIPKADVFSATIIGTLSAHDQDSNNRHSFSITESSLRFNIDEQNNLRISGFINQIEDNFLTIRVQDILDDGQVVSYEKVFTINFVSDTTQPNVAVDGFEIIGLEQFVCTPRLVGNGEDSKLYIEDKAIFSDLSKISGVEMIRFAPGSQLDLTNKNFPIETYINAKYLMGLERVIVDTKSQLEGLSQIAFSKDTKFYDKNGEQINEPQSQGVKIYDMIFDDTNHIFIYLSNNKIDYSNINNGDKIADIGVIENNQQNSFVSIADQNSPFAVTLDVDGNWQLVVADVSKLSPPEFSGIEEKIQIRLDIQELSSSITINADFVLDFVDTDIPTSQYDITFAPYLHLVNNDENIIKLLFNIRDTEEGIGNMAATFEGNPVAGDFTLVISEDDPWFDLSIASNNILSVDREGLVPTQYFLSFIVKLNINLDTVFAKKFTIDIGDTYASFPPGARGSDGADYIKSDAFSSVGSGYNAIYAKGGNDIIYGGTVVDYIEGGSGDDIIYAGGGNDVIKSSDGDDLIYGFDGDDIISAGKGDDVISGGDGNDIITAGEGIDYIDAGAGDDTIVLVGKTHLQQIKISNSETLVNGVYVYEALAYAFGQPLVFLNVEAYSPHDDVPDAPDGSVDKKEIIDGAEGNDQIVVYGRLSFENIAIKNIDDLYLDGVLKLSKQQFESFNSIETDFFSSKIIISDSDTFTDLSHVKGLFSIKFASGSILDFSGGIALSDDQAFHYILGLDRVIVPTAGDIASFGGIFFSHGTKFFSAENDQEILDLEGVGFTDAKIDENSGILVDFRAIEIEYSDKIKIADLDMVGTNKKGTTGVQVSDDIITTPQAGYEIVNKELYLTDLSLITGLGEYHVTINAEDRDSSSAPGYVGFSQEFTFRVVNDNAPTDIILTSPDLPVGFIVNGNVIKISIEIENLEKILGVLIGTLSATDVDIVNDHVFAATLGTPSLGLYPMIGNSNSLYISYISSELSSLPDSVILEISVTDYIYRFLDDVYVTGTYQEDFTLEFFGNNVPSDILFMSAQSDIDSDQIDLPKISYSDHVIASIFIVDADPTGVNRHDFSVTTTATIVQALVNDNNELVITTTAGTLPDQVTITVRVTETFYDGTDGYYEEDYTLNFLSPTAPTGITLTPDNNIRLFDQVIDIYKSNYNAYVIGTLGAVDSDIDVLNGHVFTIVSILDSSDNSVAGLTVVIDVVDAQNRLVITTTDLQNLPDTVKVKVKLTDTLDRVVIGEIEEDYIFNFLNPDTDVSFVTEGDFASFTLTLPTAASNEITFDYITSFVPDFKNGYSSPGYDYVGKRGSVTFAAGETAKTVMVKTIDDDYRRESPDVFTVIFSSEAPDVFTVIFSSDDVAYPHKIVARPVFILDNDGVDVQRVPTIFTDTLKKYTVNDREKHVFEISAIPEGEETPLLTISKLQRLFYNIELDFTDVLPDSSGLPYSLPYSSLDEYITFKPDPESNNFISSKKHSSIDTSPILYIEKEAETFDDALGVVSLLNNLAKGAKAESPDKLSEFLNDFADTFISVWVDDSNRDANEDTNEDTVFSLISKSADNSEDNYFSVGSDLLRIEKGDDFEVDKNIRLFQSDNYGTDAADVEVIDIEQNFHIYYALAGDDTVSVVAGGSAGEYIAIYGGDGNDRISGSDFYDYLLGDKGDDIIEGFGGNDYLIGGKGRDTLTGGAGDDGFVFSFSDIFDINNHQPDTISDFDTREKTPDGSSYGEFEIDFLVLDRFGLNNGPDIYTDLLKIDEVNIGDDDIIVLGDNDIIIYNSQDSFDDADSAYKSILSYLKDPIQPGLYTYMLLWEHSISDTSSDPSSENVLSYIITTGGNNLQSYDIVRLPNTDIDTFSRNNFLVSLEENLIGYERNNEEIISKILLDKTQIKYTFDNNALILHGTLELRKDEHKETIREILKEFELLTGLSFVEAEASEPADIYFNFDLALAGTLVFGTTYSREDPTDGHIHMSEDGYHVEISFNPEYARFNQDDNRPVYSWDYHDDTEDNISIYFTVIHEVLHALGVEHPFAYAQSESSPHESFRYDHGYKSATSYTNLGDGLYAGTSMLYDTSLIQDYYGVNMNARLGDTTYGFGASDNDPNPNDDVTYTPDPIPASLDLDTASSRLSVSGLVWDGGGNDTLDFSGFSDNQYISLNSGSVSSVGGYVANVVIGYGVVIENAKGGSGNDYIIGNSVANILEGGRGEDVLVGGGGADTLIGGADKDIFRFVDINDAFDSSGNSVIDVIDNFERGDQLDISSLFDIVLDKQNYKEYVSFVDEDTSIFKKRVFIDIEGSVNDYSTVALVDVIFDDANHFNLFDDADYNYYHYINLG